MSIPPLSSLRLPDKFRRLSLCLAASAAASLYFNPLSIQKESL